MDTATYAVIGSSVVGVAGVSATVVNNWIQRKSDRELASGARKFERRTLVYEQMFAVVYEWRDRIEAAADAAEKGGPDEDLVTPGPEEERRKWVLMRARLRSGGSGPVADAFERVVEAVGPLWEQVTRVRDIRNPPHRLIPGWLYRTHGDGSLNDALEAMQAARSHVKSRMQALEDLVCSELEKL